LSETNTTEYLYFPLAVRCFASYYAFGAKGRCTKEAQRTAASLMDLGADVFMGQMAGDPIALGDAGMEALAEIRTQLAIALQEVEAEQRLNLALLNECDRLEQEAEESSEYYWAAHVQCQAEREYSRYLEMRLEGASLS
jgi:hypothetical protein